MARTSTAKKVDSTVAQGDVVALKRPAGSAPKGEDSLPQGERKLSVITFTMASTCPMLQNGMPDWKLDSLPGGTGKLEKPKNLKEMKPRQTAELGLYRGPKGELGFPRKVLYGAICHAGMFVKFGGKRNFTSAAFSIVPAFLRIPAPFIAFKNQSPDSWRVDDEYNMTRNPATEGAMCTYRARFDDWEADVLITVDHRVGVKIEQVRDLVEYAGLHAGIGDNRAMNPFGRFDITNWVVKEKK